MIQQDGSHKHQAPLFICTQPACSDFIVCGDENCLLRHSHAINLLAVPFLQNRVQEYLRRQSQAFTSAKERVQLFFSQLTTMVISKLEQLKQQSLNYLSKVVQQGGTISKLKSGTELLQLSKSQLIDLNQYLLKYQGNEGLKEVVKLLEEKEHASQAQLSEFFNWAKLNEIKKQSFWFSSMLKGESMQITHNGKKVSQNQYSREFDRFCFMKEALGTSGPSRVRVKMGVSSWAGVGILALNQLKELEMRFDYSQSVKGLVMISSNGYSWCHDEVYVYNGIKFREGDVLEIEFDPESLELKFSLGPEKEIVLFVSEELCYEGNLHFGVNLSSTGDNCTILQTDQRCRQSKR